MMQLCPILSGADLRTGEDHRMIDDVVLPNKLIKLNIRVSPPFLPLVGVLGCDGYITNASIKPRVNDLLFVPW